MPKLKNGERQYLIDQQNGFRRCSKCGIEKPIINFILHKYKKGFFYGQCCSCLDEVKKKYEEKNYETLKEKRRIRARINLNNNRDKINKRKRELHLLNKERDKEYYKKWRNKNREKVNKKINEYYWLHKDEYAKKSKIYRSKPDIAERIKQKRKEYLSNPVNEEIIAQGRRKYRNRLEYKQNKNKIRKERYKIDIKYNLDTKMSTAIRRSLKYGKNGFHWENIVKYTCHELRCHIESLFLENMSWDKFLSGEIHIEHVLPKESFCYKSYNDESFHLCWGLANLRPLWWDKNIIKIDKLPNGQYAREMVNKIQTREDYERVKLGLPIIRIGNYCGDI